MMANAIPINAETKNDVLGLYDIKVKSYPKVWWSGLDTNDKTQIQSR